MIIYIIIAVMLLLYWIFIDKYFNYLKMKFINKKFDYLTEEIKKERDLIINYYSNNIKNM